MAKKPKQKRRLSIKTILKRKAKTRGLMLALSLAGIIGFTLQAIEIATGMNATLGLFSITSIILGIGLIFESQIRQTLSNIRMKPRSVGPKVITFLVGIIVVAGGILKIPYAIPLTDGLILANLTLPATLIGSLIISNVAAAIMIIIEFFILD